VNTERQNYIKAIAMIVQAACAGAHLFPSLMIAQAILESNNGKSVLAAKHNNHFGIKASTGWTGAIATFLTWEVIKNKSVQVKANFRSYKTLWEGFADRVKFLQVNPRYAKAGVFAARTPEEQAQALLKAGYATDPNYPKKLIEIVNNYNLKQYDEPSPRPVFKA
jgi:flagellum-specific peptidoglycan hydrolase FlgJ